MDVEIKDGVKLRDILVKKPFLQITADRSFSTLVPISERNKYNAVDPENDHATYTILTQQEMLRQYYPTGHKINNRELFPDIWKQDPDTKRWFKQEIIRVLLAFQQIIATKHTIHLIGNDVQFELSDDEQKQLSKRKDEFDANNTDPNKVFDVEDDEKVKLLAIFKKGWNDKGMEMHMFDAIHSLMVTAEACIVGYFIDGIIGFRRLSFLDDDKLYPHFDSITGELTLFARKYFDYDEDGNSITEWVEVWDETYLYRCRRDVRDNNVFVKIKNILGLNGFSIVSKEKHGFKFVPVAYCRHDEGPCWEAAQDSIDKFEEALSYFFENNKAFAFPILCCVGEGVELIGDQDGAVKSIAIDSKDGDAHFLEGNDVSASYNTLLTKFYELIYEQSFTVKPPELKSGDLPGVALKLLYSPAIEKAIKDAQELQPFLQTIVKMVRYGIGVEENKVIPLLELGINAWIEPYVHQNDTELATNLATAVQNGFLSKRTASERNSKYSKNDEFARVCREEKEKMTLEVTKTNMQTEFSTNEEIRKNKSQALLTGGQDINTGGGKHINQTDANGNHPNENNWEDFNRTRFH